MDVSRPAGEEVARRLLDAAAAVYTDGSAYSVRSVASRAGVNHGQVHHLFGGKEGLTRAMFEDLGQQMLDRILARTSEDSGPLFLREAAAALLADDRFARALARQVTESPESPALQREFPVVEAMLARLDQLGPEVRPRVAEGLARALGWALFAPWIRRATGLGDEEVDAIEARLGDMPLEVDDGR